MSECVASPRASLPQCQHATFPAAEMSHFAAAAASPLDQPCRQMHIGSGHSYVLAVPPSDRQHVGGEAGLGTFLSAPSLVAT